MFVCKLASACLDKLAIVTVSNWYMGVDMGEWLAKIIKREPEQNMPKTAKMLLAIV